MAGTAGTDGEEWSPKTRDDWTGLFSDAFEGAQERLRSKREEAEAKAAAEAAANAKPDVTGTGNGGGNDAGAGKKSFADRLLGK